MYSELKEFYKTLNLLCVEDDAHVLEIYTEMFGLMFQKVYVAKDGIEGFECFQKEPIDIILTDYNMPRCNGLEMAQKIREHDKTIPIIMVTALENTQMLKQAIEVNITSFLKKPFQAESLFSVFSLAGKSIIAERMMMKHQMQKLLYSDYQENLTYAKEQVISKNELASQQQCLRYHCEVFYKPKDTLSGDSYLLKQLGEDEFFLFIVDGMGKGISASVTAMMCSAFLNYEINRQCRKGSFSLSKTLKKFFDFIHPNLLEDEVVSAEFLHLNGGENTLEYATFSMPPLLYMKEGSDDVYKIKSNNPPIASYVKNFHIDVFDIGEITKLLAYSDGLNENDMKNSPNPYTKELPEDFQHATSVADLERLRMEKIDSQDDDITYIFLTKV